MYLMQQIYCYQTTNFFAYFDAATCEIQNFFKFESGGLIGMRAIAMVPNASVPTAVAVNHQWEPTWIMVNIFKNIDVSSQMTVETLDLLDEEN